LLTVRYEKNEVWTIGVGIYLRGPLKPSHFLKWDGSATFGVKMLKFLINIFNKYILKNINVIRYVDDSEIIWNRTGRSDAVSNVFIQHCKFYRAPTKPNTIDLPVHGVWSEAPAARDCGTFWA